MYRPRLLLDVDGVLADFDTAVFDKLVELGGPRYTAHDLKGWYLEDQVDPQYLPALRAAMREKGFCANLNPYPGVVEQVNRISEFSEVYFVTAAMYEAPHWMWEREQWLKRTFDVHERRVLFAHDKFLVEGDVFVDDRPKNAREWAAAHPQGQAVLWDRPYTRDEPLPKGVVRLKDWDAVVKLLGGRAVWGAGNSGQQGGS